MTRIADRLARLEAQREPVITIARSYAKPGVGPPAVLLLTHDGHGRPTTQRLPAGEVTR